MPGEKQIKSGGGKSKDQPMGTMASPGNKITSEMAKPGGMTGEIAQKTPNSAPQGHPRGYSKK